MTIDCWWCEEHDGSDSNYYTNCINAAADSEPKSSSKYHPTSLTCPDQCVHYKVTNAGHNVIQVGRMCKPFYYDCVQKFGTKIAGDCIKLSYSQAVSAFPSCNVVWDGEISQHVPKGFTEGADYTICQCSTNYCNGPKQKTRESSGAVRSAGSCLAASLYATTGYQLPIIIWLALQFVSDVGSVYRKCYFCQEHVDAMQHKRFTNCLRGGVPKVVKDHPSPIEFDCSRFCATDKQILNGTVVSISKGCADSAASYCLREELGFRGRMCFKTTQLEFQRAQDICKDKPYVVIKREAGSVFEADEEMDMGGIIRLKKRDAPDSELLMENEYCECEGDYCNKGRNETEDGRGRAFIITSSGGDRVGLELMVSLGVIGWIWMTNNWMVGHNI